MTELEATARLSYYKELTQLKPDHQVWLVQHIENGHLYVKKILPVHNTRIFESLKAHPVKNMPRILEVLQIKDKLITVEEYIAGDTLEEILEREGVIDRARAAGWIQLLCVIVSELHGRSPAIIHRDIKPSNIILSPDGVIKLLDVSAAKLESLSENKDTVLLGTFGYAAPEQYGFSASSKETDIYAIGVLLNELVMGCLPQERKADGKIGRIVGKCIELKAEDRYHSVQALAKALPYKADEAMYADPLQASSGKGWRRFLLPGIRSSNPLVVLLALVGYVALISLSKDLELKNGGLVMLITYRLAFFLMCMLIICIDGNYLGLQDRIPFLRNKEMPLHLILLVVTDVLIMVLTVFLLAIMFS